MQRLINSILSLRLNNANENSFVGREETVCGARSRQSTEKEDASSQVEGFSIQAVQLPQPSAFFDVAASSFVSRPLACCGQVVRRDCDKLPYAKLIGDCLKTISALEAAPCLVHQH